ncbi:MAG: glutaredoxin domain-containing protein [Candidatus Woesearchaeota archaeon]
MKVVKIYSTPTCPWCVKAKEFLKDHKVDFENLDVAKDEKARNEMIEKSGQMGVPVIIVDDVVIVGFDQNALKAALDAG